MSLAASAQVCVVPIKLPILSCSIASAAGRWRRFAISLPGTDATAAANAVEEGVGVIPADTFELPRVPDSLVGLPSRFFYAMQWPDPAGGRGGAVIKVGLQPNSAGEDCWLGVVDERWLRRAGRRIF